MQQQLAALDAELAAVSASCSRIEAVLEASRASTGALVAETGRLQGELGGVDRKLGLVDKFLHEYQLSTAELETLRDGEIGPAFFAALERVRAIHGNCRMLLRTHHQRAGLELMDSMARYQEAAYERLCRWVQAECRSLGEMDSPEVAELLQTATLALKARPVLYKYCAEEVATARHNVLFRRFIAALTKGGAGGGQKPIEMHANDPRRYVGDMLAWLHQALASERELMRALFGEKEGGAAGPGAAEKVDELQNTTLLLDRTFEGVCRPFRVRVEQVLMSSPGLIVAFKLNNLLEFYHTTVSGIIGRTATLAATLAGCQAMAASVFEEQLKTQSEKLLQAVAAPPANLLPSAKFTEGVQRLLDILESSDAALEGAGGGDGPSFAAEAAAQALEPLKLYAERSAARLEAPGAAGAVGEVGFPDGAKHMYVVNCLVALQNALLPYRGATGHIAALSAAIQTRVEALASETVGRILATCGLEDRLTRIRLYLEQQGAGDGAGQMAKDDALRLEVMSGALRALFGYVQAGAGEVLPTYAQIRTAKERDGALAATKASLVKAYKDVYDAILDPANGYGEARLQLEPISADNFRGLLAGATS